jgi:tRNA U34 2-thiouridine synthase MnmA/TrmU
VKKNILVVSQENNLKNFPAFALGAIRQWTHGSLNSSNYFLEIYNTNWISEIPHSKKTYTAQIRYHGEFLPCKIKIINKTKSEIIFKKPVLVASGQSCVIYDKNICLGGGVVVH